MTNSTALDPLLHQLIACIDPIGSKDAFKLDYYGELLGWYNTHRSPLNSRLTPVSSLAPILPKNDMLSLAKSIHKKRMVQARIQLTKAMLIQFLLLVLKEDPSGIKASAFGASLEYLKANVQAIKAYGRLRCHRQHLFWTCL